MKQNLKQHLKWNHLKDFTCEMIRLDFELTRVRYHFFLNLGESLQWENGHEFTGVIAAVEIFFDKNLDKINHRLRTTIHDIACTLSFSLPLDDNHTDLKLLAEEMAAFIFGASVNPHQEGAADDLLADFTKKYPHLNIEKSRRRFCELNGGKYL